LRITPGRAKRGPGEIEAALLLSKSSAVKGVILIGGKGLGGPLGAAVLSGRPLLSSRGRTEALPAEEGRRGASALAA
jgi:hypothetical protein